jgi:hypothetical protein
MMPPLQGECHTGQMNLVTLELSLPTHKAQASKHGRQRRNHAKSLRLLFSLLAGLVLACALILFSMMQRMTLNSTLYALMNAILHAEFVPLSTNSIIVDMHLHDTRNLETIDIEKRIIGTIYTQLLNKKRHLLMEIIKGAHVVVENDEGRYYEIFKNISTATYTRISSHFSRDAQYAVPQGGLLDTLLTGTTRRKDSWFQFEGANWDPIGRPLDSFVHVLNYIEYKIRGVQIGPLGTSEFTDSNPLRIRYKEFSIIS